MPWRKHREEEEVEQVPRPNKHIRGLAELETRLSSLSRAASILVNEVFKPSVIETTMSHSLKLDALVSFIAINHSFSKQEFVEAFSMITA
jgi:hypothetical protein